MTIQIRSKKSDCADRKVPANVDYKSTSGVHQYL